MAEVEAVRAAVGDAGEGDGRRSGDAAVVESATTIGPLPLAALLPPPPTAAADAEAPSAGPAALRRRSTPRCSSGGGLSNGGSTINCCCCFVAAADVGRWWKGGRAPAEAAEGRRLGETGGETLLRQPPPSDAAGFAVGLLGDEGLWRRAEAEAARGDTPREGALLLLPLPKGCWASEGPTIPFASTLSSFASSSITLLLLPKCPSNGPA